MALVIEDGSLSNPLADSFVSRVDYIAHAATLGITIADVDATDIELVKAAQFIAHHEGRLKGTLVDRDQPLPYPRADLVISGFEWAITEIPRQVILCQMAVALDIRAGIDPYNPPQNPTLAKKRVKVEGAVDIEYFGQDTSVNMNRFGSSVALLNTLLRRATLRTSR